MSLNLNSHGPKGRQWREPTESEKWLDRLGFALLCVIICFGIFYRFPRFVLLIYFPTFVPFVRVLAYYALSLGEPWMRKVIVELVSVHCLVLLGVTYLWRTVPILGQRVDYAFIDALLIVLIESCVVAILLHFQRPRQSHG